MKAVIKFSDYLRQTFGERVQRVSIHGGMTCPNRDGTTGEGGCIYCDNGSFHMGHGDAVTVAEQMERGREWAARRYKVRKFIAYFQTFSNTYAPVKELRQLYSEATAFDDVVGLMVGTRPDCLDGEKIALLAEFNERITTWVELGLQTSHDRTLKLINRGHDRATSEEATRELVAAGIPVAAHAILGLPGESEADMLATADWFRELGVQGVKLHHLHAVKGTPMETMLNNGQWSPPAVDTYVGWASRFMAGLPAGTVMMRLVGDCPDELLLAPRWKEKKSDIQGRIWDAYHRILESKSQGKEAD